MTNHSPLLDLPTLERWIHTICDRAKLTVRFKEGVTTPCTDQNGNILLPPLRHYMTEEGNTRIRHNVLHECLHHIKGPEVFDLMREAGFGSAPGQAPASQRSPLAALLNILEDYRIEREGAKDYKGDQHVLRDNWNDYIKHVTDHFTKTKGKEVDPRMGAVLKAVCESRMDWESNPYAKDFYKVCPPEMDQKFEQLEQAGMVDRMKTVESPAACWKLAQEMYELLFEKSAQEEMQRMQQEAEAAGKGKSKKEGDQEGDGRARGKGKPGEGDEEGEGKARGAKKSDKKEEDSDEITDLQIYMPSEDVFNEEHECGPRGDQHVDYSEYDKGSGYQSYNPCPLNQMKVTRFRKGEKVGGERDYDGKLRMADNASPGFIVRIKRELQIKSAAQYIPNQKKGKLHARSLWKVTMPQVGNGEWNRQVFRKRIESDILDCAVQVLTDWSGSMGGEKCEHAAMATSLLNDAMHRGLHIPIAVAAFSEKGDKTAIGVIKEFDEPVNHDKIRSRFTDCFGFMSGNCDGDAIMWAYNEITKRKEKRRVLIVLSDGSPSGSRSGDLPAYTKEVIQQIEKSRHVEIYGIGIMDNNVKRFYKRYRVIKDASELEQAVIEVVRERILA